MSTMSIVAGLLEGAAEHVSVNDLMASSALAAPPDIPIPTNLLALNRQLSRTYDLSVTAAGNMNIPVIGSVSGGFNRRVIVLERTAFKEITSDNIKYEYGYAIRLAITVSKITADMKLSLPFLAASAEVGHIEGSWSLQVVGLSGAKIDAAVLPPDELSVETFVLAKQSLTKLINAVHDPATTFSAVQIRVVKPADLIDQEYRNAIGLSYAIGSIEKGRSIERAIADLGTTDDAMKDTIRDTYKDFVGITVDNVAPQSNARAKARTVLGDVKVGPR